jgi:hypothetical protein
MTHLHAVLHALLRDVLLRCRVHGRQVERGAAHVGVRGRDHTRQHTSRAADIGQCCAAAEVKLGRQLLERSCTGSSSRHIVCW